MVWDVESSSGSATKILYRPLSEEPTASICWLDAHVLVVGTSISWVRLYDVRISAGQQGQGQGQGQGGEIMSIMAHAATRPRKVKGIRCDQLQQHVVATFSDSPGEPIKIWDLRKAGASAKPKLMIVQSQVAAVVDVAWSAARAGSFASIPVFRYMFDASMSFLCAVTIEKKSLYILLYRVISNQLTVFTVFSLQGYWLLRQIRAGILISIVLSGLLLN